MSKAFAASASTAFSIDLVNSSGSADAVAYITGQDDSGTPFFVLADGTTQKMPDPSAPMTRVADYSIPLDATGRATTVPVSGDIISGRLWFSTNGPIAFYVNPGPALVQPSFDKDDPTGNWLTDWSFCEFTYNSAGIYANISYVDLVVSPISMRMLSTGGTTQTVSPLPDGALAAIAADLTAQAASDGFPWDTLVATDSGGNILRIVSPQHAASGFDDYWTSYVDQVWSHYASTPLTVDTDSAGFGSFTGQVSGDTLVFAGLDDDGTPFTKPGATDIFGCNTGPFLNTGSDARGAVAARLGAAINRSTLLASGGASQPDGVPTSAYYGNGVTNHYSRIVHDRATVGYAFPYDDVGPTGAVPVDGHIQEGSPSTWTVTLGNGSAS
ncbi:beta-1,3-glucanase family protein [Streptomyces sp. SL13]|uniref:Beta-1,3-glucanase family protein n=1 Tax=Streptantibioticus silvisoli TaxID=2705255 RepID=A0AA90H526_9ACTN|nr:beta-1,3-glucanase family protein [Streptantibioticus silvisoli]MDI5971108.1 beta-1,3-glucanase family protein [Streptantibioticus silvisoli]